MRVEIINKIEYEVDKDTFFKYFEAEWEDYKRDFEDEELDERDEEEFIKEALYDIAEDMYMVNAHPLYEDTEIDVWM
jgi:hypothetical protein